MKKGKSNRTQHNRKALTALCEERKSWHIGVDVDVEYVDAGSGQSYSQQFYKRFEISPAQEKKKREAKEKSDLK